MNKSQMAEIISYIFSPVFETPLIILLTMMINKTKDYWITILILTLVFVYLLPWLLFRLLMSLGKISDTDITKRQERHLFFTGILIFFVIYMLFLYFINETSLFYFYLKLLIPFLCFFTINFFWKISGHMLVNSIFILLLYFYIDKSYIIIMGLLLLFLIGWSRIILKKHSLSQVLAGSFLAGLLFI